jgi:predicted membrane channel-forming protein YqfA (hemolysin III family)
MLGRDTSSPLTTPVSWRPLPPSTPWSPPVPSQLFDRLGATGGPLIVAGGLIYSAGAAVYALRRPDPVPAVFGYHEIFHLLVIAGVAAHFLAITLFAVPIA